MKDKVFIFITYLFSLAMITISLFAMYFFLVFKSYDRKTQFQMNIGEVKEIIMMDYYHNTNKIEISDKQEIKSVLFLIKEMRHQPVCFCTKKILLIKGDKGNISFGIYNNCLKNKNGEYICDINLEKFITDVYGKNEVNQSID